MAKRERPVIGVQRRYAWRLYPTPEQAEAMSEHARMCAQLWNALLEMCERRMGGGVQRRGKSVSFHCAECASLSADGKIVLCDEHNLPSDIAMGYWISAMRAECPEWSALSTWTPRRVATSLFKAFKAFFKRAKAGAGAASGYPRFKAVGRADAIPHRCVSGCSVRKSSRHEQSWNVHLQGVPDTTWARGRLPKTVNEWMDADISYRAGRWEISVAVAIDERRSSHGHPQPITVRFDLIDGLASVNGVLDTPDELIRVKLLDDRRASMQAEFDTRWPRGKRWSDEEWAERCEDKAEIGRLAARIARVRNNALHVWSARLVCGASVLTIYKPAVKEATATPRGDAQEWGAAVKTVSAINRSALSFAPAMAVQMLEYKAKEIGIPVQVVEDAKPEIAVGHDLSAVTKAVRKARRVMKKEHEANVNHSNA
jgi:putative transposase